jgi:L-threonylcarbamoyladenylate synthase
MRPQTAPDQARRAAELLRSGGVVAFPTETVYGLGADASNAAAVQRVFRIKGRPATNPLIVHVADAAAASRCVMEWPDTAERLAERFWPGPLTIVLPKDPGIANEVTAGGPTVGVRVPDHPVALAMLRQFAELVEAQEPNREAPAGVAAPSANRSNYVSPTTAQHVRDDLGESVDMILDGGPCTVGIESTVLSLATPVPTILRPGGVSLEQLREVLDRVELLGGRDTGIAASPGRQERHYMPRLDVELFDSTDLTRLKARAIEQTWEGFVVMPIDGGSSARRIANSSASQAVMIPMPDDPAAYARDLYGALREAEGLAKAGGRAGYLFIELPPDKPEWAAVRDRLLRMGSRPTPASPL